MAPEPYETFLKYLLTRKKMFRRERSLKYN